MNVVWEQFGHIEVRRVTFLGGDLEPPLFGHVEDHFLHVLIWESYRINLVILENEAVFVKDEFADEDHVVENITVLFFDWHETMAVLDDDSILGS